MSQIKVKNFGPIKEGYLDNDGWLDIRKVTLFIGNQGSGKSTIAKLISCFKWIEKVLIRGDYKAKWFTQKKRFVNIYCTYHRLQNYFKNNTNIEYKGSAYHLMYKNGEFSITKNEKEGYELPQIMYVPAERNFISTIRNPELLKLSSDALIEFLAEFDNAKKKANVNGIKLPINNTLIEYDHLNDIINIKGEDYKIRLPEASSGFQSVVPLYLVSWYLAFSTKRQSKSNQAMSTDELKRFKIRVNSIWSNDDLTEEQKRAAISVLSTKFNKTAFINVVEEPEQNLFPSSQQHMLYSLLRFNNMRKGNQLIITTHSPYIINFLTIAIQGMALNQKIDATQNTNGALDKLQKIVPTDAVVHGKDVVIYQLNEKNGSIKKLSNYEGVPSDDNYLNQSLAMGNELFDTLLEIEQGL